MQIEVLNIDDLVFDPANARKHSKKNLDAIVGSLAKFGQQKPIVVDKNNVVVAGNGTLEAAKKIGWSKINCVRTDLTGPEAIAFALADNRTAELAEWDIEPLQKTLASLIEIDFDLNSIGFDADFLDDFKVSSEGSNDAAETNDYSKKIESPIYQPTGPKPSLKDCVDTSLSQKLMREIDASNVSEDDKQLLRMASYRHIIFNYQNIANYYAHSSPEVQNLMENSALVIIDFNKAIERGFVVLSKELAEAYANDRRDE